MSSTLALASIVGSAMISSWAPPDAAAPGSGRVRVGVSPLSFEGKAEGAREIDRAVADALVDHETDLVRLDRRCDDDACRADQAAAAGVGWVLDADVAGELNDYRMKVSLYDASGRRVKVVDFACEICTPVEAATRMSEQVGELRDRMTAGATTPTARAEETELEPSASSDHAPARRDAPEHDQDLVGARKHRTLVIAGWSTAAAGVAAVVAGSVLLALDERPYRAGCTGSGRDVNGECEFLYDTLPGGAAAVAVGGVALVTGIALAVVGKKRARASNVSARVGLRYVGMEVRF